MGKNTININGAKLEKIISDRGLNIYEIPQALGFSKNVIKGAIRTGKASPVAQNVLLSVGISKEMYEVKEEAPKETSLDSDMTLLSLTVGELKAIIKEAVREAIADARNS